MSREDVLVLLIVIPLWIIAACTVFYCTEAYVWNGTATVTLPANPLSSQG